MNLKLLWYCTKNKPYLLYEPSIDKNNPCRLLRTTIDKTIFNCVKENAVNGKIVAESDYEVEEITYAPNPSEFARANSLPKEWNYDYQEKCSGGLSNEELLKHSCLTNEELSDYLNTPTNDKKTFCKDTFGYAIHIKNLHIFDKPKKLGMAYYMTLKSAKKIQKAPQNMCIVRSYYLKNYFEKYILISVHPEWACKILNGEKTIEVRKQVLNCMKGD